MKLPRYIFDIVTGTKTLKENRGPIKITRKGVCFYSVIETIKSIG